MAKPFSKNRIRLGYLTDIKKILPLRFLIEIKL